MHRTLRELVVAASLPMAIAGCRRPGAPATTVAMVNGEPITVEDVERDLAQARLDSAGLGPRSSQELEVARKGELDRLIQRTELLQAARQEGVASADADVDRALLAMKSDYAGTSFEELRADEEISPADLRARLRNQLTIRKLFKEQVFSRVVVTPQEVEAYYQAHPAEFDRPEQVHAEQVVVKTAEEAQALRAAIKAGTSFEEVARKRSLSPDGKRGGDLGWFSRGMMPPIFDQICFSLPVGQLSDVVASTYGFHLFRVLDARRASHETLAEASPAIEAKLREEKNAKAEQAFVDGLAQKARVTVDRAALARVR